MEQSTDTPARLVRRLGAFDAPLIVMGGVIGSGIFMNPSVVAQFVHSGLFVMLAWLIGGLVAMLGAGLFAELAARRPRDGGLYAYVRDAFHPSLAFIYGWTLLLVSQSGGMAAAAVTFAAYFVPLTGLHVPSALLATVVIGAFTIINCLGVRQGASTQNTFMLMKIGAIIALILVGAFVTTHAQAVSATVVPFTGGSAFAAIGLALVPVFFAYNGFQTSSFMSGELRDPGRTLSRGIIIGMTGVIILYLAVNAVCLHALGAQGLAATNTPASDIVQLAFGPIGARAMAAVVALSTLGYLGNQILTSPRVYFQMASDGLFFSAMAKINHRTNVPVIAIAAQGLAAMLIAFSGRYDAILNYVTSVDYIFFGLAAIALFVFRAQDARNPHTAPPVFRIPAHPYSTGLFLVISWVLVIDVLIKAPRDTIVGFAIFLSGIPVYLVFAREHRRRRSAILDESTAAGRSLL